VECPQPWNAHKSEAVSSTVDLFHFSWYILRKLLQCDVKNQYDSINSCLLMMAIKWQSTHFHQKLKLKNFLVRCEFFSNSSFMAKKYLKRLLKSTDGEIFVISEHRKKSICFVSPSETLYFPCSQFFLHYLSELLQL
jgi:hypothetical protein